MKQRAIVAALIAMLALPAFAQTPTPQPQSTIGGNALDLLPQESTGEVSVLFHYYSQERALTMVVLRNDTDTAQSVQLVTMEIYDTPGKRLSISTGWSIIPPVLAPGELALVEVHMRTSAVPPDTELVFTVDTTAPEDGVHLISTLNLRNTSWSDAGISGVIENPANTEVSFVQFDGICFDDSNAPSGFISETQLLGIAPMGSVEFHASFRETDTCTQFLIAAGAF